MLQHVTIIKENTVWALTSSEFLHKGNRHQVKDLSVNFKSIT